MKREIVRRGSPELRFQSNGAETLSLFNAGQDVAFTFFWEAEAEVKLTLNGSMELNHHHHGSVRQPKLNEYQTFLQ